MKINTVFKLLRFEQWTKNLIILIPAFFAGQLTIADPKKLLLAIFTFSMASGTTYIFNDLVDVERDRLHPMKQQRPLAAGLLNRTQAIGIMLPTFALAIIGAVYLDIAPYIFIYLIINLLYTIWLKNMAILDLTVVTSGYIIRILIGGIIASVNISHWLFLMTFLLSHILLLGKRRDDLVSFPENHSAIRKSLKGYSIAYIDIALATISGITIVCYVMYTLSEEVITRLNSQYVYVSTVFVFIGIMKFLQAVVIENEGGSPTRILLKDRMIQASVCLWILFFAYLLYV